MNKIKTLAGCLFVMLIAPLWILVMIGGDRERIKERRRK